MLKNLKGVVTTIYADAGEQAATDNNFDSFNVGSPKAVEELFATKVATVRTINRKGKRKRNRTSGVWSSRATRKRAIVTLAAGEESIDIFGS